MRSDNNNTRFEEKSLESDEGWEKKAMSAAAETYGRRRLQSQPTILHREMRSERFCELVKKKQMKIFKGQQMMQSLEDRLGSKQVMAVEL